MLEVASFSPMKFPGLANDTPWNCSVYILHFKSVKKSQWFSKSNVASLGSNKLLLKIKESVLEYLSSGRIMSSKILKSAFLLVSKRFWSNFFESFSRNSRKSSSLVLAWSYLSDWVSSNALDAFIFRNQEIEEFSNQEFETRQKWSSLNMRSV